MTQATISRERERIRSNLLVIKELKRRTTLLATFASLFYNIGQLKKSEEVYVVYIQMVEQNYGLQSLETSNCYYLVGVFYLENSYLKKAMACIKRALDIRLQHLGPKHAAVADCYYNIGLVFYVIGDRPKATSWILNALSIRVTNTGEENIYVAKIYEMLAQLAVDERDLRGAFDKLQKSLKIKSELFTDPSHPEVQRTLAQLQELAGKIGIDSKNMTTMQPRPRHASAGASLQTLGQQKTINKEDDASSLLSNIGFGLFGQGTQDKSDIQSPYSGETDNDSPTLSSPSKQVAFKREILPENLELLKRFIREDGKIITEEDREESRSSNESDEEDDIKQQIGKNQQTSESHDSDEDESESDDEAKTELKTDPEFLAKLNRPQKDKLAKLKSDIFGKSVSEKKYNPIADVVNSGFFNSLSPKSREHFRTLNMHIFNPKT